MEVEQQERLVRGVRQHLRAHQPECAKEAFLQLPEVQRHANVYLEQLLRTHYTAGHLDIAVVLSFLEALPNWSWTLDGCSIIAQVDRVLHCPDVQATTPLASMALPFFVHSLVGRLDGAAKVRAESYWYEWFSPTIRALVRGQPLMFTSVDCGHGETLYAPSSDFAFDRERRNVFCWRKDWEPDDNKEKWQLIPASKQKDRFYILHRTYEEYLYAADYAKFKRDENGHSRSRAFLWRHPRDLPGESGVWQLIPVDPEDREIFAVYNTYQREFLYAPEDCYDHDRRHVLTTKHRPQDQKWLEARKWRVRPAQQTSMEQGIEAFFMKQYALAVDHLTKALHELPDHTEHVKCYAYRMTANLRLRNFEAITADYREIQALGGQKAAIFHGLAHLWEENTAFLEEIEGPFLVHHQLMRAEDCLLKKQYDVAAFFFMEAANLIRPEEASAENERVTALNQRAEAWLGCAKCFYVMDQIEVAVTHLENALLIEELSLELRAHTLLWQGKCFRKQGKYDEALASMEKAFDIINAFVSPSSLSQCVLMEMMIVGVIQKRVLASLLAKPGSEKDCVESVTSEQSVDQIMELFHCPLSMELMTDPVMTPNGETYERSVIERHLEVNGHFDPFTRAPLTKEMLYPNKALKTLAEALLNEHRLGILLASCSV